MGVDTSYDGGRWVSELFGAEAGRRALVVLGGVSGNGWRGVGHDVLIGCNGANQTVDGLDYWLGLESDSPIAPWQWIPQPGTVRVMSRALFRGSMNHRDRTDCDDVYLAERSADGDEDDIWSMKHGLWYSNKILHPGEAPVGTSATNVIHFAALLGCNPVHTIGLDLCFKDESKHHHYPDELYNDPAGRKGKSPFRRYDGVLTTRWFLESAIYLHECGKLWRSQGLDWQDHSDGLLHIFDRDGGYREELVT